MDIMNMIEEMYMPIVLIACLLIGYVVKKWVDDVDNKYIPTLLFVIGGVLGCVATKSITLEVIISGCASGLGATGLHQMYKQLIEKEQ